MSIKAKTYICMALTLALIGAGCFLLRPKPASEPGVDGDGVLTLTLWYTDEALTDYINSAALKYYDAEGVRVEPTLKGGADYMDAIVEASYGDVAGPDLYIVGTESLEQAALSGVAAPVGDPMDVLNPFNYPDRAMSAVTYGGQRLAYPFYYETAFLLYNATYLTQIADTALRTGIARASLTEEAEEAGQEVVLPEGILEGYTQASWEEAVYAQAAELLPSSIEDIVAMASEYSAPEGMESYFLWDVSDIFYNYFFTGAYMELGGETGDDPDTVQICNADTVRCMEVYQGLHQFFSIESKESSYDAALSDFMEGKTLFTIATTDALTMLKERTAAGTFPYDYGVAALPGVDGEHRARGLSTTTCIVVNGLGAHRAEADLMAEYLCYGDALSLYERTGKLPCAGSAIGAAVDATGVVRSLYEESAALPKRMAWRDFWVQLELAYTRIWDGADPEETMRSLEDRMRAR